MKNKNVFIIFTIVILVSALAFSLCIESIRKDSDSSIEKETEYAGPENENSDDLKVQDKTIYLTFDDGPSEYTEGILDILESSGVKATFFVTGDDSEHASLISDEYNEGHAIGIHCMYHKYYNLYHSESRFWADFEKAENLVYEKTGEHVKIMRFPGGSSNTVAETYGTDMKNLIKGCDERGYTYFDWDVDSMDAQDKTEQLEILENIKQGALNCKQYCVILCHDTSAKTAGAIEEFLPWALENGYNFDILTLDSPTVHHVESEEAG